LAGSTGAFLQIRGLSVAYSFGEGDPLRALDGVRLELAAGEALGILGESGCGKSTLANAVLRLLPLQAKFESGEILFCSRDLLKLPESELRTVRGRKISLIPQDPALSLNPVMAVGSQITEVLRAHLPLSAKERRERVKELLREVGFDAPDTIYGSYPHQLSGGQRQRIVIAQAVACRPALIIADEPTSKLDASLRAEIIGLLAKIRLEHGTSILIITHDPVILAGFADRVAVMYAGKFVEIGSCSEIFRRPLHPYTEALVNLAKTESSRSTCKDTKYRFPVIEGEFAGQTAVLRGCSFEPRCSSRLTLCAQRTPRELTPEPARSVSCFKYGE
jgi:oligopeptide/dipeptide ABC transporter ATP-binding protein